MKRALVTGANGHIGSNLVHDLVAHGWKVRALVREGSDRRGIDGVDVELVTGDVLDVESVRAAVDGQEVVFHAAAPYRTWAKDPAEITRPMLVGTENVLRAAKDKGVARVVCTSSCNAVGFTDDVSKPRDETMWNDEAHNPYGRGKLETERRTWELSRELGLDVVTVLPTTVLGGLDYKITPTTGPALDAFDKRGPMPFSLNLVDVRDVARAHVLAAEKGRAGERYLAGGDNASPEQIASMMEKLGGNRPATKLPPMAVLWTVATLGEWAAALTGKAPMITRDAIRDAAGRSVVFTCDKARDELGLEPRGGEDVLRETLRWGLFMKRMRSKAVLARAAEYPPDPSWKA